MKQPLARKLDSIQNPLGEPWKKRIKKLQKPVEDGEGGRPTQPIFQVNTQIPPVLRYHRYYYYVLHIP